MLKAKDIMTTKVITVFPDTENNASVIIASEKPPQRFAVID
jgi:hypothetical protein